ncbi:hypothetical protein SAY86_027061 [Trapa natans]|uniref:Kinesin-like protein n=1 Tax=Trapa natans TaxID=22666 RepID=A0AAN7KKJ6_TRANT|nr:hypothetical protein SAY86_027061 [Trapa natans]
MSNFTVCARFRPVSSRERQDHGDSVCIHRIDDETFSLKDDKEYEFMFSFDRVFYEASEQADVYKFLARPIVQDAVNAINGTIITYGQTGAGKTYSMEGVHILDCDEQKKGILQRVIDGLFEDVSSSHESIKYTVMLSMVEIYMGKIRDLLDPSKDNIQIKESKSEGILLSGVTKMSLLDPADALLILSNGLTNRAVGETLGATAFIYSRSGKRWTMITVHGRIKCGKLVLVDLAGSEKIEKTGAEGMVLEEAKTINKSLSALGKVVYALTCGTTGRGDHIPYRDSKLTRILKDALGGNSRTALLCCCSPSPSNAAETVSTLRFGARAKHVKVSPRINVNEDTHTEVIIAPPLTKDDSPDRISDKVSAQLLNEDVKLLKLPSHEQVILFDDPSSMEDWDKNCEDGLVWSINQQHAMEELASLVQQLEYSNNELRAVLRVAERLVDEQYAAQHACFLEKMLDSLVQFLAQVRLYFLTSLTKL